MTLALVRKYFLCKRLETRPIAAYPYNCGLILIYKLYSKDTEVNLFIVNVVHQSLVFYTCHMSLTDVLLYAVFMVYYDT